MNDKALTVTGPQAVANVEDHAMSVATLLQQVKLIQQVQKDVMKDGEHYGTIPGTKKPTLLKAGAEKLVLTFRFDPEYDIIREVRANEMIAYTVKCTLFHLISEKKIASGIGSCNSRESKYRYRSTSTGKQVPKEYWDTKDPKILGGTQFMPRKQKGKWIIFEQVEHDNPWDYDNTIIKMACKRALVAAILNATAASDIFTQDLEDLPDQPTEDERQPDLKTFDFLKAIGGLKKRLGDDEWYYAKLGEFGPYKKSNDITKANRRDHAVKFYQALKDEVESREEIMKQEQTEATPAPSHGEEAAPENGKMVWDDPKYDPKTGDAPDEKQG